MTLRIVLTRRAQSDLESIWDHTAETWSLNQAEAYFVDLNGLLALLAEQPKIARERTEFTPPIRIHPFRSHLVIFRVSGDLLQVIRVVHVRANWAEWLVP